MSAEAWLLTVRISEEAASFASVAAVVRSLDTLIGAGAWVDFSVPAESSMLGAAQRQMVYSAQRHRTSRTGRAALAALRAPARREREDWKELGEDDRAGHSQRLIRSPEGRMLPPAESIVQEERIAWLAATDTWRGATDTSSVDWLRRELGGVAPDAYDVLTGWAQVGTIRRESPTLLQVILSSSSAYTLARFGPGFVIAAIRTLVDGWDDVREERRQHAGRMEAIDARRQTILATEEARQEAARLVAEACRQGRRALEGSPVDPDAIELAERIAAPALNDLVGASQITEVSLERRAR